MRTERLWDSRSFCLKSGVSTLERMKSQNSHEKFTVNTSCRYLVISGRSPQGRDLPIKFACNIQFDRLAGLDYNAPP